MTRFSQSRPHPDLRRAALRCSVAMALAASVVLTPETGTRALAQTQSQTGTATPDDTAQDTAVLVADDIRMTRDNRLRAEGNVAAFYQGQRLRAHAITYDRTGDRLTLEGPITVVQADGTVLTATSATLDRKLYNGVLTGARIVMKQQLQLAAQQVKRTEGRYSELYKASVTSCQICNTGRPPLWQIRAEKVVHDRQTRQLYFKNAQFRVLNTPIFFLPRLRLPDPTLARATGFLVPSILNSSLMGVGARVPYFFRIGDSRDLTVAPILATKSRSLELRYRQAFRTGNIELNGAVSKDDFAKQTHRGYLFGDAAFDVPRDFKLRFNFQFASDDTYLLEHNYSEQDRLQSELSIERVRRDEYIRGAITHFKTLRVNEKNSTLPSIVGNAEYERRLFPRALGGELRLGAQTHSNYRSSNLTTDGPDFDPYADGHDVTRLTFSADWDRNWVLPAGVLASLQTGLAMDNFHINQAGLTSASQATELTPSASLQMRWPLVKQATATGATHVIEPVVQLSWAGGSNPNVPGDQSTRIEFDEGNLFNPSRFTAPDRRERGASGAYGVSWTRIDPQGWQGSLALGQVVRDERQLEPGSTTPSFSRSSGLRGRYSDLLLAGQFKSGNGLTVTARSQFDSGFDATKSEARASWRNELTDIGATFIWLGSDPAEARTGTISEWAFDGSYRLTRHWTGSAEWRYDASTNKSVRAGMGVTYTNECVDISLSAARRFTSTTVLAPSTEISLTIGLRGYSARSIDRSYSRSCKN